MKKKILFCIFLFLVSFSLSNSVYSQGNTYIFDEAMLSFSLPDNWEVSREHVLLLMMPQPQDFEIKVELSEILSLDKYILETINELKNLYPLDTIITRTDFVIEKMKAVELNLVKSDEIIVNYVIIESPAKKIVKMFFIAPKAEYLKYKGEINKIKQGIKKKS